MGLAAGIERLLGTSAESMLCKEFHLRKPHHACVATS
jgi:hypothetical protein